METEAFFFRHADDDIFAIHYLANHRDEGFVLCHPAPQDMMRAHHSQLTLARRLQSLGFPVLRFDYSGTGDSTGSIVSLERWKSETLSALSEFKKRSGLKKVSIIGTRLGASLAIMASQETGIKRLLLWDPVVDGGELLRSYAECHHRLLNRVPDESPYPGNQKSSDQSCGYPWPKSIQEGIAAISPDTLSTFTKRIQIVNSEVSSSLNRLVEQYRQEDKEVSLQRPGEDMNWAEDRYLNLRLFAPSSIRILCQYAEENA
jgi:pimeloyl-ACP methyl ester carboxylesterase